jgi:TP901 family phage tail tape measure protein
MAEATASTKAFSGTLLTSAQQNSAAFTSLGIAAVAIGAGIGLALKAAADAAIDFESSFAGIRKTVDATEPEFAALAQGMRDLSKEIPVNVNELNRIGEAAGQLGIQKEHILDFTRTVADLGATTNLASDDAANALARISNIMGTSQSEFDRLGSTIVALGNAGASTEAEIVEFGLRMAGAGKIAGLTTSDILAIGNAMSSVGVQAEAGGTAVQKVLIEITKAVVTGAPELEKFAETAGMSAQEFAEAWRTDPAEAFTLFVEGLGLSGDQAIAVLDDLGLTDQRLIRSFLSLSNAGDLLRSSIDLGSRAWEENNALTAEAEKRYDTTASKIAIAQNRINDAAISFGQLMLPAIAAVMGAFGDFADLIGGLPGPVRAIAIAVGILAAGLFTLAGATLILLPRIAAVKTAMAGMGIQTGLLRGSLSLAASAFNPLTLALTAATIGIGIWASKQAEAGRRVEELTDAIQADSGALGENTRARVVNTLSTSGALQAARNLGIEVDKLVDSLLGDASAMNEVNAALDAADMTMNEYMSTVGDSGPLYNEHIGDVRTLRDIYQGLPGELADAKEQAKLEAEAIGESGDAHTEAAGAAEGNTEATGEFTEAAEEATSMADQFREALELLAGMQLNVEKASLAWLDSIAELTKELKEGTRTLDKSTQAGRDNRQAVLNSIDAAIEHAAAIADETGNTEKAAQVASKHIKAIIETAEAAGFSKKEIREYIAQLNLTPEQIKTEIRAMVDAAAGDLDRYKSKLDGIPRYITTRVQVLESGTGLPHGGIQHAGGLIMHSGGLAPDEVPAILQRGEFVMSRRATQRLGTGMLSMLNRMHEGGLSSLPSPVFAGGASSPTVNFPSGDVYLQVDGQTFARISRAELLKLKGSRVSLGLS